MTSYRFPIGNHVVSYPTKGNFTRLQSSLAQRSQCQGSSSRAQQQQQDHQHHSPVPAHQRKQASKEANAKKYVANTQHRDIILQQASSSNHLTHRYVILLMLSCQHDMIKNVGFCKSWFYKQRWPVNLATFYQSTRRKQLDHSTRSNSQIRRKTR